MPNTTLYILCGFPFAGKTTLAKQLEKKYGFTYISPEQIVQKQTKSRPTDQEWDDAFIQSYQAIDTSLGQGKTVVFDTLNFFREQRNMLRVIAEINNAQAKVLYIPTNAETVIHRWRDNRQLKNRHDVPSEDFNLVLANFDIPTPDENVLEYHNDQSVEKWMRENIK